MSPFYCRTLYNFKVLFVMTLLGFVCCMGTNVNRDLGSEVVNHSHFIFSCIIFSHFIGDVPLLIEIYLKKPLKFKSNMNDLINLESIYGT